MQFDRRGMIVGIWLTLLAGTLSSTLTLNYFANTRGDSGMPVTLSESTGLIVGLWIAGLLIGVTLVLLGWHEGSGGAAATALAGYLVGALIRLIFLGQFLPGAASGWELFWNILTLQDLPPYHAFVLMVFFGGGVMTLLAVLLARAVVPLIPSPQPMPIHEQVFGAVLTLMPILILCLIVGRSLTDDSRSGVSLIKTEWLTLPQTNMILAAVMGFIVGGTYACSNRVTAGVVMFLALAVHVILMMLLNPILAAYDPFYGGINANRVGLLAFIFFWIGTPVIGAIAAFALHNLRDAFRFPVGDTIEQM